RKDAESGLADARQKLGRIEVVAPSGTEITLDDSDKLGTAPLAEAVDVEPGAHTLRSPTETVRVVATAGQVVQAKFEDSSGASAAAVPAAGAAPGTDASGDSPVGSGSDYGDGPPEADTGASRKNLLARPENMTPVYVGAAAA